MKLAHSIEIMVFGKQGEDAALLEQAIKSLIPMDFEKEKLAIEKKKAEGFEHSIILVMTLLLKKEKHIDCFLKEVTSKLNHDQKDLLIHQWESRINDDLEFYFRLDK